MAELLACPFCGANKPGNGKKEGYHYMACMQCNARGPLGATGIESIAAWNKRAGISDVHYHFHPPEGSTLHWDGSVGVIQPFAEVPKEEKPSFGVGSRVQYHRLEDGCRYSGSVIQDLGNGKLSVQLDIGRFEDVDINRLSPL